MLQVVDIGGNICMGPSGFWRGDSRGVGSTSEIQKKDFTLACDKTAQRTKVTPR